MKERCSGLPFRRRLKNWIGVILLFIPIVSWSQTVRTSYFMDVPERLNLNPALLPSKGYVHIGLQAEYVSNAMSINDFRDLSTNRRFDILGKLNGDTKLNAQFAFDVLSIGFYKGKHFWSGHITARVNSNAFLPKQLLMLAGDLNAPSDLTDYTINNMKFRMAGYAEAGVGYGTKLTDRLSIGARLNVLVGMLQSSLDVDRLDVYRRGDLVSVNQAGAKFSISPSIKNQQGLFSLSDIEFNKFAISGIGITASIGARWQVLDELNLSVALNDLGYMGWNNTTVATGSEVNMDINNISDDIFSFLPFGNQRKESVSQGISPVLNVGAEYAFFKNKLGLGLLSSTRFGGSYTASELTLSANYRPSRMIALSASYSMLQSHFKTIGLAFKLGAFFIGTDYLFFTPLDSKTMSAYVGLNIPLGKYRD